MLNPEQITFYQKNGYLLIEDAVHPDHLATMQQVTHTFIENSRQVTHSNDIYDLDKGHSAETPRLTRIKLPHTQHPIFWDVLCSEHTTSILSSLVGPDIRLHNSKLNTKAPGGGAAVEWHQDWAFYPHTNDDLFAVGIMLSDVKLDNGPLLVIPGSHTGASLNHSVDGVFCGAINPEDPAFDASKAVPLIGKAGSMSIHHVRTLHASAPNLSDEERLLLFFEGGAADAWPIGGISSACTGLNQQQFWDFLTERMICGTQTLHPRLEKVPVTMPLPPAPDSTSIFKVQESAGAKSVFSSAV